MAGRVADRADRPHLRLLPASARGHRDAGPRARRAPGRGGARRARHHRDPGRRGTPGHRDPRRRRGPSRDGADARRPAGAPARQPRAAQLLAAAATRPAPTPCTCTAGWCRRSPTRARGSRAASASRPSSTIHGVWGGVFSPAARLADLVTHWTRWGVVLTAVSDAAADPIRRIVGPDVPVGARSPTASTSSAWRMPHVAGDPDEVRLVAVMRLAPRKRAMPLVQMARGRDAFLPRGRRLRLTIVGDGPVTAQVQRYVERHGLDVRPLRRRPRRPSRAPTRSAPPSPRPTRSSRRPSWSRSASPRSRRAPRASRSSRTPRPGSRSFVHHERRGAARRRRPRR